MTTVKLSCFADEISKDLHEQLEVLEREGFKHLEVRNVWGKNVLALTEEELLSISGTLKERSFRVSSVASPIGKYPLDKEFAPELESLEAAVKAAHILDTPYIRIFSYHIPKGEPAEQYRDEVLSRMKQLAEAAERHNVTLILENESGIYGNTDDRCLEVLNHCSSANMIMAFDPGNFVRNGVKPMTDGYPKLSGHIGYVHIKDARGATDEWVPAGDGDGEIPELLQALKQRGFDGYLSVEPHLTKYLPEATGAERVTVAIRALKKLLDEAGVAWE
jgi:sugar phosphate isomerase/epimerase